MTSAERRPNAIKRLTLSAALVAAAISGCSSNSVKRTPTPLGALKTTGSPPVVICNPNLPSAKLLTELRANENARTAFNYLHDVTHLSRYGAAAVAADMFTESRVDPAARAYGSHGVLMWSDLYWAKLDKNLTADHNPNTLATQLELFTIDLESLPSINSRLRSEVTTTNAITDFEQDYERPAQMCLPFRTAVADAVLAVYS